MNNPGDSRLHFILFFLMLGSIAFLHLPNTSQSAELTLAWSPNAEPDVVGYKLHYGTTSRGYSTFIDTGKTTNCTVSDLAAGTTYYFAVTAYNTAGATSAYSDEIGYSVPKDSDGDGIPDDLEINYSAPIRIWPTPMATGSRTARRWPSGGRTGTATSTVTG